MLRRREHRRPVRVRHPRRLADRPRLLGAALDTDDIRAAAVRGALGKTLADEPYAAEEYDATAATLAAWDKVPAHLKETGDPWCASLAAAVPAAVRLPSGGAGGAGVAEGDREDPEAVPPAPEPGESLA